MRVSYRHAAAFWLKLGCISFGGPAGQIAIMHSELVERRRWIDETRFLQGLSFATLLPGPEAQQLATYIGWRLNGVAGGITAGSLFVLPGGMVMLALSWLAARYGASAPVAALFSGLKPVVIAIIIHAVWRIGRRTLRSIPAVGLAAAAFAAIHLAGIGFPWIVAAAGLAGWLAGSTGFRFFGGAHGTPASAPPSPLAEPPSTGFARLASLILVFVLLWALPLGLILALVGREPFLDIAVLFTKAAFVTFGGAYAVLPYVAEAAVQDYGWLTPAEMINGLALAETTPGPLILVLQYVGFFAGWSAAAAGDQQLLMAVIAAGLTTYVTFLPSFLFILAGAPYMERLFRAPALGQALGAITAAVVGVILNLGVFLAEAVLWPATGGFDAYAASMAGLTLAVLLRWSVPIHWLVLAGAAFGLGGAFARGTIGLG